MQIRDLCMSVDEETTVPPGLPEYRQGGVHRAEESDGYESDFITTTLHVGTHVDAPLHFDPEGRAIGDIGLEELVRPTKRADVRDVSGANEEISLADVKEGLQVPLEPGDFLLVHTGWADENLDDPGFWRDGPYYSPEIGEFVVERGARGLITDTRIDTGERGLPNHYTLCENDKVIVENVVNLAGLPDEFTTWVMPIKLARGEGAPARVFVLEEGDPAPTSTGGR